MMLLVATPSLKPGSSNFDTGDFYSILLHSKKAYGEQNYKMVLVLVVVQTQKQNHLDIYYWCLCLFLHSASIYLCTCIYLFIYYKELAYAIVRTS